MSVSTVLVIGASGRMGNELIRSADKEFKENVHIHAFVRDAAKLSDELKGKCASVVVGDATSRGDVQKALDETGADTVILAIGAGDSTAKTDIRERTAEVLMEVVPEGVKVAAVSSLGAGGSKIKAGFGIGMLLSFYLRHVIHDHNGQEASLKNKFGGKADEQLLIVRPTNLTENKAKGLDHIVEVGIDEKLPGSYIDRADVAKWILTRVTKSVDGEAGQGAKFGGDVNLTSV